MRSASSRHRQRLLAEAFEQGIRHFDVARMYGLGMAEGELGRFAQGQREELVIATKFGIEPAGSIGRLARLQAPARAVMSRLPALRQTLKRHSDVLHQPRHYDVATARTSLQTSLRELGTDYVDILFIHDPELGNLIDTVELGGALEEMRHAGLLRAWGIAGESEPCIELSGAMALPTLLQIRDGIFTPVPARLQMGQPVITFGIFAYALHRIVGHVVGSSQRRLRWSHSVGEDCGRPEVVSALLLQDALDRNSSGTVLFSTTRLDRLRIAMSADERLSHKPDLTSLRAFRELVLAELGAGDAS